MLASVGTEDGSNMDANSSRLLIWRILAFNFEFNTDDINAAMYTKS